LQHFGDAASSLGAHLYLRRQQAQDDVYSSTYDVNANPALTQTVIDTKKQFPDGGPGFMEALQTNLDKTHADVTARLAAQGLQPSEAGQAAVTKRYMALKSDYLVKGVVAANNEKVTGLQTQLGDNVDALRSSVLSGGMSLDDALKGVETNAASGKSLFSASQLVEQKDKWQQGAIDAAIENKVKAGDLAGAQSIRDQYYGKTPRTGTMSIYDAIHQQESGGGANTSTSVTGARGDMQIQPATFKQYAKPGESIDSRADNITVGKRIIDDLTAGRSRSKWRARTARLYQQARRPMTMRAGIARTPPAATMRRFCRTSPSRSIGTSSSMRRALTRSRPKNARRRRPKLYPMRASWKCSRTFILIRRP
jgi:hypothetical protein